MQGRGGYHHGFDGPKRYRRDDNADPTNPNPSIVVHVRNLHQKVTEADLLEALSNFGPVAYATCIPHSRMALVEFEDIEGAKACVNFATSNQINVGGQGALFNYSTSQCIERMGFESATPNKVLVVTVLNAQYPIDADVIYQISNAQGKVLRVAVMHKPTVVQALVEFESMEVAKAAKHAMNGADIYSGCCTLKVEFAKPDRVRVQRQDKDQRDFTLPDNESFQDTGRKTLIPAKPDDHYRRPYEDDRNHYDRHDYQAPSSYGYSSRGGGHSDYYGGDRGGPPHPPPSRYRDDYEDRGYAQPAGGGPGCVMMIYGLEHGKINCDMLFNILCQYGNVLRISFMRTKTETGIIELGTPEERQNVLDFLQGSALFGLTLEFKPSHQECVHHLRDPFLLPDGSPSFKDYSSSRNQRFSTPELAAKNRIIFPTNTLHWFNAPGTMDEQALLDLMAEKTEHKPVKIDIFPSRNERSAAGTAEFETVEIANEVLALVNHTPVNSPYGSAPFIVKWAYATPRRWDGSGGEPPRYEEGGDGERKEGFIQPAHRPSPSFRGRGRGYGDSGFRRESYRGGLHGSDRYGPYPPRGGGFRGGRGRMDHHSKAKELLQQRDELDGKIKELMLVLETNNSTMDSPLLDAEGYPLNTIDVYAVRHARHDLICLRNDRAALTEKIVVEMENENKEVSGQTATSEEKPVHRTSNEPFVKISSVVELSPADIGGFRKDDLIIQYGNLHHGNFNDMQEVAQITKQSEDKIIRVTVIRENRPVRLEICPKKWSGPGLLGCNIVPISGANV